MSFPTRLAEAQALEPLSAALQVALAGNCLGSRGTQAWTGPLRRNVDVLGSDNLCHNAYACDILVLICMAAVGIHSITSARDFEVNLLLIFLVTVLTPSSYPVDHQDHLIKLLQYLFSLSSLHLYPQISGKTVITM